MPFGYIIQHSSLFSTACWKQTLPLMTFQAQGNRFLEAAVECLELNGISAIIDEVAHEKRAKTPTTF
jgi:hypothetical protein